MIITFQPLQIQHLLLLLKWLETPHVKAWWDQDVLWTPELIEEKYGTYVQGYKLEKGIRKPMYAYIITVDDKKIGYIQYYNAYDFERDNKLVNLPKSLAAFDIFIGEENYVGKGIGSKVLRQFCDEYIFKKFRSCLVDPDIGDIGAIKAYEKAGFEERYRTDSVVMMIRPKKPRSTDRKDMNIRLLNNKDIKLLTNFLEPHKSYCMFICSNLKASGIEYKDAPFHGYYWGCFDDASENLLGVIVRYWNGNIMMCAPDPEVLNNLTGHLRQNVNCSVQGILGADDQARLVIRELGLLGAKYNHNRTLLHK